MFAGLIALLVTSAPDATLVRLFSLGSLRWFGRYSYGLYVYHFLLLSLVPPQKWYVNAFHSPALGWIVYMLIYIGGSIAIALASFHLFESKFTALKDRLPFGRADRVHAEDHPDFVREQPRATIES